MSSAKAPVAGTGVPATTAGAPGPSRTGRRSGGKPPRPLSRRQRPLWMLTPGGVLMTLVIVIPFLLGIWISLTDLDQYSLRRWLSAPFVGFKNYVESLSSGLPAAIWISISFALISTVVTLPIGIAAAVVTQNKYRGRALIRAIFLIPYVLPSFVVATVWRTMLQPDGIVNIILNKVGISNQLWLSGPTAYWTLILVEIWAAWPFIYLLALSGLQSVDGEVHEASALDGATWWPKLRYIVLPYLRGPLALACLLATLNHINNFTLPFVLFGAPAPDSVNVMPMIVYVTSFQSLRFGLSAAMAIVSLIIIAIPLFIYLRAVRLDVHEEGAK
jgi:multiple sugar transport system permease protein